MVKPFPKPLRQNANTECVESSLSLVERRAFMKLPLEKRRQILAEQAEKLAAYYEQDSERQELQGGDIVEY